MRLRLLVLASLAAMTMAAPAAGRLKTSRPDAGAINARHLARLRLVFREAYEPDVLLSSIVYSSGDPEQLVALRRSGGSYWIFTLQPSRSIWSYGMVEMFRSRIWTKLRVKRGGGTDDLSDAEAARLASTVPADPRRIPLLRCAVAVDPAVAARLVATWQRLFLRVPAEGASGNRR
jgi:hypothetical protein